MTVKEIAYSAATIVQADDLMEVFSPLAHAPADSLPSDGDEMQEVAPTDGTAEDNAEDNAEETAPAAYDGLDAATMIKCVNMAAAELSHDFPALVTERVNAENGVIPFSAFAVTPVSVRRVEHGGKAVSFSSGGDCVRVGCDGQYLVTFATAYGDCEVDDEIQLGAEVDGQILTYLTARNYCLITGRTDEAGIWDQRYVEEKQNKRMLRRARMPSRRFV